MKSDNQIRIINAVLLIPSFNNLFNKEKELKNAYIGGHYEYSYDFRGKTTSQATADGWTLGSGVSIDTN